MPYCSQCGKEQDAAALFCGECGSKIISRKSAESTALPQLEPEEKDFKASPTPKWVFISIAVVFSVWLQQTGFLKGLVAGFDKGYKATKSAKMETPEASFYWECSSTTEVSMQCSITNNGPETGALSVDVVAKCADGDHVAQLTSQSKMNPGDLQQRVLTKFSPPFDLTESCFGIEYRNAKVLKSQAQPKIEVTPDMRAAREINLEMESADEECKAAKAGYLKACARRDALQKQLDASHR